MYFPKIEYIRHLINFVDGYLAKFEEYEKELISAAMKKYKSFNKAGKELELAHRIIPRNVKNTK